MAQAQAALLRASPPKAAPRGAAAAAAACGSDPWEFPGSGSGGALGGGGAQEKWADIPAWILQSGPGGIGATHALAHAHGAAARGGSPARFAGSGAAALLAQRAAAAHGTQDSVGSFTFGVPPGAAGAPTASQLFSHPGGEEVTGGYAIGGAGLGEDDEGAAADVAAAVATVGAMVAAVPDSQPGDSQQPLLFGRTLKQPHSGKARRCIEDSSEDQEEGEALERQQQHGVRAGEKRRRGGGAAEDDREGEGEEEEEERPRRASKKPAR